MTDTEISQRLSDENQSNNENNEQNDVSNKIDVASSNKSKTSSNNNNNNLMQQAYLDDLMKSTKDDILKSVNESVQKMFDNFKETVEKDEDPIEHKLGKLKDHNQKEKLPTKMFYVRESVLTILLKISHIRTLYHMCVAILIIFSVNTMITDWVEKGGIFHYYHVERLQWAFGNLGHVSLMWIGMQIAAISIYPIFLCWLDLRTSILPHLKFYIDRIFFMLYFLFQFLFLVVPITNIVSVDLPPCSSAIVICENIRFMMKCHAFIRENVEKEFSQNNLINRMNFSRYLYFLFAPTLVYRDSYPRNQTIRWPYVASNFAQVIFCIVYMYYIFTRFCVQHFSHFNNTHVAIEQLVVSIFGCMLPGTLMLLICFFCFLHSWLNAFAEMLQFGDRLFYKEWWNSTTFSNYYRTWNVVVHDWLYSYVYRDVYTCTKNRSLAMTIVFMVSALVHEYVLIVMFKFFFPVLFILFGGAGFGMMFLKGRSRIWNVGFWVAMFIGTGIIMCLYSMEWYARINCSMHFNRFLDPLIPRTFFCRNSSK